MTDEHGDEGYTGDAVLVAGDREVTVRAVLRGYFQPIDGRYHWYGPARPDQTVTDLVEGGRKERLLWHERGRPPRRCCPTRTRGSVILVGRDVPVFVLFWRRRRRTTEHMATARSELPDRAVRWAGLGGRPRRSRPCARRTRRSRRRRSASTG
ncbi:DUF4873 domain-containing protein [Kutzneria sp. 744]|uniref:DUF4873 domain-containing protein n=1 Tax=Kutzneria sp. (strain 744) TaxID=345341 RepID=UPI0012F96C24